MKSINLKKVSSILMRVLFILFVLCLVIGLIDGIRNNNWDVFYGCLVGFLLIFFLRIIYDVIELIVRRFTNHENTLDRRYFQNTGPSNLKMVADKVALDGIRGEVHSRKRIKEQV